MASSTPTPFQPTETFMPTSTPEPLAAKVNWEGLSLAEFQAELQRFQAANQKKATPVPDDAAKKSVLDDLVNRILLSQAARATGHSVDDATVQQNIDALVKQLGSAQALTDWETANFYTDASFRQALTRDLEGAWQRDEIAASVPTTADQVHARQIMVLNEATANKIEVQLKAGADFATLAFRYDPLLGGDLGWFPRGYLTQSAVEEAAFNLQPGQFSEVLQTSFGYQIIYVVERDANHPLSQDALLAAQHKALEDWLQKQRTASAVEVLIP